jgi:hypothetical protein
LNLPFAVVHIHQNYRSTQDSCGGVHVVLH